MNLLELIYYVANTLAVIAMTGTACVIVVHMVRAQRERKHSALRQSLSREIMRNLQDTKMNDATVALMRRYPGPAAELLEELCELITGTQRELLLQLAQSAGLDRWLMDELHSWKADRRQAMAEALGLFNTPKTISALTSALDDLDPDVRIAAALALANLDAVPPVPVLVEKLNIQRRYRPRILRRLLLKVAPKHFDDVFSIAEGRVGSPFLRPFAIEALGATGNMEFADRLAPLIDDPSIDIRATILRAIALLGVSPRRDIVAEALDDKTWEVRAQAVQVARRLDRYDLLPRITALANDESWWVRFRARESLAAMGEAGVERMRRLVEEAERPTENVQQAGTDRVVPFRPRRAGDRGAA